MSIKTKRITESAMLMAIAVVLELLSKMFIPNLPFGGQITLASMLPVVLISYRHGVRWGLVAAVSYSLLQMAIGMETVSAAFLPGYFGSGTMIDKAIIMCSLDYVLAFTMLGLGGLFRNRLQNPGLGLMCGSLVSLSLRCLCHIASGYILFADYAEWFFTQEGFPAWGAQLAETLSPTALALAYSSVYNLMYMVPEMIVTALIALLVARIPRTATKIS